MNFYKLVSSYLVTFAYLNFLRFIILLLAHFKKMIKYINKCISTRTALRNFTELPSTVGIGGVAPSVGFTVWITTVVVWKGGKSVFMWCLR